MRLLGRRPRRGRRGPAPSGPPWVAIGWLGLVVLAGMAAPVVSPHDPIFLNLSIANLPPGFHDGSGLYLLGTDNLGRDVLSRLIWGVRPLLQVSVASVAIAGLIGLVYGVAAAMTAGWFEFLLMRLADIQLSIPLFVLALLLAFTLKPGIWTSVIAIVIATWPYYARLVRTDVIRTRGSAYVQLARVAGRRGLGLAVSHVLPNSLNAFVALCILNIGVVVILAAALSFLGLGVQPPTADWGNMVAEGTQFLDQWWMVTFAGIAVCSLVVASNSAGTYVRRRLEVEVSSAAVVGAGALEAVPDASFRTQPRHAAVDGEDTAELAVVGPAEGRAVLEIQGLTVLNPEGWPILRDVSISVPSGKVVGIMGESGSGKSTICKAIVGLLAPALRITAGTLRYGEWSAAMSSPALERLRGRHAGIVFQDPLSSLNPVRRIGFQLGETRQIHGMEPREATRSWVRQTLAQLGFRNPRSVEVSYPHQLSGGMRQRVCVGIAFSGEPRVVLADEPTTALDVSLQGRILRLLTERCKEERASLVIVSHDVRVIREIADEVTVLYGGRVLESGPARAVLGEPRSPYTRALLESVPLLTPELRDHDLNFIPLRPAGAPQPRDGCPFAGRCSRELERCRDVFPDATRTPEGRTVWCWNPVPVEEVEVAAGDH